nr:META domain-containing protein [uncultured Carboxylicivirga sp.]
MKYLFLLALSLLTFTSCKTMQKNTANSSDLFIESNQWELSSFKGMTMQEAGFSQDIPHITINQEKSRIGGYTGCNSFGGDITIKDNTIEFGLFMATKRYCDGVPEAGFFELMNKKVTYSIDGNKLTFIKDGEDIMEFQLKPKE